MKSSPVPMQESILTIASNRKMAVTLTLLLPMLLLSAPVPAQESNAHPIHESGARHKHRSLDDRFELLARYLDLSNEQRSALKDILLERQQEIVNMRHAPAPGAGLQMDRLRTLEDQTADKIRAILTEEQRKKYNPLGEHNSASTSQNLNVDGWLKGPPPR